jgi:hypothetical protein
VAEELNRREVHWRNEGNGAIKEVGKKFVPAPVYLL